MARRVVVVLLEPPGWAPPGIPPHRWRAALAEDVIDVVSALNAVEPAVAAGTGDLALARELVWPGTPVFELAEATVNATLAAAAAAGYDEAVVVAADAPDVPGLVIGKLLRPLTTRPLAVAPGGSAGRATGAAGRGGHLLGVAARLPAPAWLPPVGLDHLDIPALRAAAPRPGDVVVTDGWRRLRGPADLGLLDPSTEGWEATRALLTAPGDRHR